MSGAIICCFPADYQLFCFSMKASTRSMTCGTRSMMRSTVLEAGGATLIMRTTPSLMTRKPMGSIFTPVAFPPAEFHAAAAEADADAGDGNERDAVRGENGIADDRVDLEHVLHALHGVLHEFADRILIHCCHSFPLFPVYFRFILPSLYRRPRFWPRVFSLFSSCAYAAAGYRARRRPPKRRRGRTAKAAA